MEKVIFKKRDESFLDAIKNIIALYLKQNFTDKMQALIIFMENNEGLYKTAVSLTVEEVACYNPDYIRFEIKKAFNEIYLSHVKSKIPESHLKVLAQNGFEPLVAELKLLRDRIYNTKNIIERLMIRHSIYILDEFLKQRVTI